VTTAPQITYLDDTGSHTVRWQSQAGWPAPKRAEVVDDTLSGDRALQLLSEGVGLVWQADFHNARLLLQTLTRRMDRKPAPHAETLTDAFHLHRKRQGERARLLGRLLVRIEPGHKLPLRRAPAELADACSVVYGEATEPYVVSVRELQGVLGAWEWRKVGLEVPVLGDGARIFAHYGVFAPVRSEYLRLVAEAPLPAKVAVAMDIGTGTGVLAALLLRRGVQRVVATDTSPRALACAADNLARLGLTDNVDLQQADLFAPGLADLIVCNPPWLPVKPTSQLETAIFDPNSQMLRGFLAGLRAHLQPGGEGWLILSDLAERLGLRSREDLLDWIAAAGLQVVEVRETRPTHPRTEDASDPLHAARSAEVTGLWRLRPMDGM
jgi:methylase of polypeptide subunit release factors